MFSLGYFSNNVSESSKKNGVLLCFVQREDKVGDPTHRKKQISNTTYEICSTLLISRQYEESHIKVIGKTMIMFHYTFSILASALIVAYQLKKM